MNTAVLFVSHDFGVIAEIADHVVVMYAGMVVETGLVREIFRHAAHPYTQALLQSIPRLDERSPRLYQIPGTVPSPAARPPAARSRRAARRGWPCARDSVPPMIALGAVARTPRAGCNEGASA